MLVLKITKRNFDKAIKLSKKKIMILSKWPKEFSNKYYNAKTRKQRAIIVGKVIDAYIKGDF
jgi:hypothetical protein